MGIKPDQNWIDDDDDDDDGVVDAVSTVIVLCLPTTVSWTQTPALPSLKQLFNHSCFSAKTAPSAFRPCEIGIDLISASAKKLPRKLVKNLAINKML